MLTQRADLTFKHNLKQGRHGWLRLTPAYSVRVVGEILDQIENPGRVLDPFCGTGTTGLVCAERGLTCASIELNPFLVWFATAKTRNYTSAEIAVARQLAKEVVMQSQKPNGAGAGWVPSIHRIERWWSDERLRVLSHLFQTIQANASAPMPALGLLKIAFCRLLIDWSNAAFNHQSMSFKETTPFYDTLVPVEQIYASLFKQMGFDNIHIKTLRKRNSKKELIEFCVEARYPGD